MEASDVDGSLRSDRLKGIFDVVVVVVVVVGGNF